MQDANVEILLIRNMAMVDGEVLIQCNKKKK